MTCVIVLQWKWQSDSNFKVEKSENLDNVFLRFLTWHFKKRKKSRFFGFWKKNVKKRILELWHQIKRLQSVMNSAARGRRFHRPSSTTSLHTFISYMTAPEHIQNQLAVLAFKYCNETAPTYLVDELFQPADLGIRSRLRSASTSSLPVRRTRLSTVGDRAFPIAALLPGTHVRAIYLL